MTVLQFVVPRGEAYKQSPMQIVEQSPPTQRPEPVVNTTLSYVIVPVGPWTTAHQGGSQHWHWTGGLFLSRHAQRSPQQEKGKPYFGYQLHKTRGYPLLRASSRRSAARAAV